MRRWPSFVTALWLLLVAALPAHARHGQETGFLNRRITVANAEYKYQIYVPEDWAATQKWPVILFLHGSGERGSDGLDQTQIGLPAALRAHPERWPFLVVMPQLPYQHRHWTDPDMMAVAMAALESTIKELKGDRQRVYLTGMSLGGYGAWEVARRYPRHFAAVVPVCGGVYWPYAPERGWPPPFEHAARESGAERSSEHGPEQGSGRGLANDAEPDATEREHDSGLPEEYARALGKTPVWMFHGADDPVVPPRQSEVMFDAIRELHGDVRLWEYSGWQHNVWEKAYAEQELPRWLLAHRLSMVTPVFAERILVPVHPVPVKLNPDIYDAYVGEYEDVGVVQVTIFRQGDGLFARNHIGQVSELLPETPTTFFYPHGGASRLLFQKNQSGQVKGILFRDDRHEETWERRETPDHRR